MDVIQELQNIESVDNINFDDKMDEEDIRHIEIIRLHLYFIIVGLFLTLFMVLL